MPAGAKSNGVSSFPSKPVATTTYEPPSSKLKSKLAITSSFAGAIPTVNDVGNSRIPVADL